LLARLRDGSAARSGVHATQGARTAQALREAS
jgi:hypothetical protein